MGMNRIFISLFVSCLASAQAFAVLDSKDIDANGSSIQSLHVVNLLANSNLSDPGMTPTPILVKYYNGNSYPCWTNTLNFQEDIAVHAGNGQGCVAKINQVVIIPLAVADKLKTYSGPATINIDTNKFSNHLTIIQDQAPIFDVQNGLIVTPGSMNLQLMAD